jgi:CubicO group peptidase (beta-lactamase class C family)
LLKQVDTNKSPSVQYILFDKESIIKRYNIGFSDIKEKRGVDNNTTYNALSVTKTFTALAILQLAEQKKLDIEQPIIKYLTDFQYSPEITVRQLLTHSAGIPNPIPLSWVHLTAEDKSFDRNQFFRNIFNKNIKIKSKPNEKFAYSNLGYILLGQLIEKVSGVTYEAYIENSIIKKLGIKTNDLGFKVGETGKHAKGYIKRFSFYNLILSLFIDKSKYMSKSERGWKPFRNYYVNGAAYGGLIGTPDAFVKYIQELLRSDCQLITNEYKMLLFTENFTNDRKPTGMCIAWFRGQLTDKKYFSHAGGGGGYYVEIRIYPESGIGSVIFFNRTGMSDERFLDKVDRIYFERKKLTATG